jgi:hypothetical protein
MAEEFVLEMKLGDTGGGVLQHGGLLKVDVDGVVDPHENNAVHLHPSRPVDVDLVGEDVISKGIFSQDNEEDGTPSSVVVADTVQDHWYENLDVEDGDVYVGVLGLLCV